MITAHVGAHFVPSAFCRMHVNCYLSIFCQSSPRSFLSVCVAHFIRTTPFFIRHNQILVIFFHNMYRKLMKTLKSLGPTTPYKDDGSKVAELKQQISQKMILLHCAAVKFFINICCFWACMGPVWAFLMYRHTYHFASACRILSE